MIDYRKSFVVQLYDENTLEKGPIVQVYGMWSREAKQEFVSYLKKKFPGFMYDLIGDGFSYPKPIKWITHVESKMIEELF